MFDATREVVRLRFALPAFVLLALVLGSASLAFAAPTTPTMGLTDLEAALAAGPVSGHFATVVRGDTVVEIPVEVLAVTSDSPGSALILFEASGPLIDKYGGIASGMSGSPLYLEDAVADKLVGAVSYGDYFTLGGAGLATPIESMMNIEAAYAPKVQTLQQPVLAAGSVVSKIIVTPKPEGYSGAAEEGAFVAKPLASVFIGGIDPSRLMYRHVEATLKAQGVTVVPLAAPLGATALQNGTPYSAAFAPGGSVAAMGMRGDMWMGGIGTVTYTAGNAVLAFGHPAFWDGPTNLYMMNAWIDGVWPSSYSPYKMGRPGAVHGTVTQDRSSGIMGLSNVVLAETPVTAQARTSSGATASSAVYLPTAFVSNPERSLYAAAGASVAGSRLYDQSVIAGSAVTETTVVVRDDRNVTYTIKVANLFDSNEDITASVASDVFNALYELASITESGLARSKIISVNLKSSFSPSRRNAEIANVSAPYGLRAGAKNRVRVSLYKYGVVAAQSVDVDLWIPAGTRIEGGTLAVTAPGEGVDLGAGSDSESGLSYTSSDQGTSSMDRRTVAEVVKALNSAPSNNAMSISFYPGPELDEGGVPTDSENTSPPAAKVLKSTDSVLAGQAQKSATRVTASLDPSTLSYGGSTRVSGRVYGVDDNVTVYVYGRTVGQTAEKYLGKGTATYVGPHAEYDVTLSGLKKNTVVRVAYKGTGDTVACEKTVTAHVRAKVGLATSAATIAKGKSVKLTATVLPVSSAGSKVAFQRYSKTYGKWVTITTKTLTAATGATSAKASYTYTPSATRKLRVRFLGSVTNVATKSSSKTIYVK